MTRAIGAIYRRCDWTTYYKLIERGRLRIVPLAQALLHLMQSVLPLQTLNLVIDDTLALRHSLSAPGCAVRHDHAHKTNRPDFVLSQFWVTLDVSVLGAGCSNLALLKNVCGSHDKSPGALDIVAHDDIGTLLRVLLRSFIS
ncbi:hypothetical protein [Methylomonas sp. MgM2]